MLGEFGLSFEKQHLLDGLEIRQPDGRGLKECFLKLQSLEYSFLFMENKILIMAGPPE